MKPCHNNSVIDDLDNNSEQTLLALTREARKLHKQALSPSKMKALPVLRRLIKAEVFNQVTLVELYQTQANIQRKHLLNLLAKEMGYGHWSLLRAALSHPEVNIHQHPSFELVGAGYPNLWFSNMEQARDYISTEGGKAIQVGQQAVVVPHNQ